MATFNSWVTLLTTDVNSEEEGLQVVGQIYPLVGSEWLWFIIAFVFVIIFLVRISKNETEELDELSGKSKSSEDYKNNIANW